MIIGKSEVEWHDAKELPEKDIQLLIVNAGSFRGMHCGEHDHGELGFYIPDEECRHQILDNVLCWSYFPEVHIVGIDNNGKPIVLDF